MFKTEFAHDSPTPSRVVESIKTFGASTPAQNGQSVLSRVTADTATARQATAKAFIIFNLKSAKTLLKYSFSQSVE